MIAAPNPKRAKMYSPNGRSSSSRPEERKIERQRELIIKGAQNFDVIRNMPGFVDHTHFIQSFLLAKQPKLAIFAPRRFGKSSHLNMVKMFLQIDVDKVTGKASDYSSVYRPARWRNNYNAFNGTRIITDDHHKDLVQLHLGMHPVIHLDFKIASINSIKKARMHCRKAVQEAYREHPYLKTSTTLVPGDRKGNAECQNICEQWCSDERFMIPDLERSLKNLSEYLYNHFEGAKVYILVDEFDAINASALREVRGNSIDDTVKKLRKIRNILADILEPAIKGGLAHVAGVLITGVSSYMSGLAYSSLSNNFTVMRFLDGTNISATDKGFVPFYGATTEEVGSLIQKLVQNKELVMFEGKKEFLSNTNELDADEIMRDVQSRYNGYFDMNGTRIFCLWSVLQYLQSGKAINYWNQTDEIDDLYGILKCEKVVSEIMKLMKGDEFIECKRYDKITIRDLVKLHDLMQTENVDEADPENVFNFLIDQGYLSYPEGGSQDGKFKLPNAEIRAAFSNMIRNIVKMVWKISTTSFTSVINDISLSLMKDKKSLQDQMLHVYGVISKMLRSLKQKNESRVLCAMYNALDDAKSFELCVDLPIKDAEGRSITSHGPHFLLLHKYDKKCAILWELRYKDSWASDIYKTSLYALQEARGNVATKNGKTKKYMNSLKKLGREALVIGLSIHCDLTVSLSYSLGMEIFYSEREYLHYPALHPTCNLNLRRENRLQYT